jgi:hypothetical protein
LCKSSSFNVVFSIVKKSMKTFTTTLILVGLAWKSLAYNIDESCSCAVDNLKQGIEEAIAVLTYSSLVAYACAALDTLQDPSMQLVCQNERRSNLLEAFFGDSSGDTYTKIAGALSPASKAPGTYSDNPDGTIAFVCGDAHLVLIGDGAYRDKERGYAYVRLNPAPLPGQRPCDVLEALTYSVSGQTVKTVVMICDKPLTGINRNPTFGQTNKGNVHLKSVDALAPAISSTLTHELIHVGNSAQFPRQLGDGQLEEYLYAGCASLENTPYKFSN